MKAALLSLAAFVAVISAQADPRDSHPHILFPALLTPEGTQHWIDTWVRSDMFAGRKLLDHDATFELYYTPNTLKDLGYEAQCYTIHVIYAQDLGYGYSRGPLSVWVLKMGKQLFLFTSSEEFWANFSYMRMHK